MIMKSKSSMALIAVAMVSTNVWAATAEQVASAKTMLGKAVGFATVEGRGQVPVFAAYLAGEFRAVGFSDRDIVVEPFGETAALLVTYRGQGQAAPILLNAHMDVVEAKREDWNRDPFVMAEEGGYLFGRGVYDNKFDLTMVVQTLLRLRREGFKPRCDLVLVLTGDEETKGATAAALAPRFKAAAMMLNCDAGGGTLSSDHKPLYFSLQTAEKTYADFKLTVTNPGGHSSVPTSSNAINELAAALVRIAAYKFPAESSETTRAYFREVAKQRTGELAVAMARFADDPTDAAAIATLSAEPHYVGQVRTTCVATMITGGHAENALPQRAVANINARIFPGTSREAIRVKLQELVGEKVMVTLATPYPQSSTSPLHPDLMEALKKAVGNRSDAIPIVPSMAAYATDSLFFRAAGIPSYGVSGLFIRPEDAFDHGLDERVPVAQIAPTLDHYYTLLTELAK
jgi:acetylornithine deacetylase/succinyl-diaminopimelate desuccinylase-like protein